MIEIILTLIIIILSFQFISWIQNKLDQPISQEQIYKQSSQKCYIQITKAGGFSQLKLTPLKEPTIGANLDKNIYLQYNKLKQGYVMIKTYGIGVNYADICIRWGLYERAKQMVGFPICPGFEFSGTICEISDQSQFYVGQKVFGLSLFGGYSTHVIVPEHQVFALPQKMSLDEAAGFPCVALTAYYALFELINFKQRQQLPLNVLVHSAGGGVGSMLVQMLKIKGSNICAVVGSSHKVEYCKSLGATLVIDKSKENLWQKAEQFAPKGYDIILDANGVETLQQSYNHLGQEGKLIIYGFHTLLPKTGTWTLFDYLQVIWGYIRTPRFSPLTMTSTNRSILAFNLSFCFNRTDVLQDSMKIMLQWVDQDKLKVSKVTKFKFWEVAMAHQYLESAQSIGKIILTT